MRTFLLVAIAALPLPAWSDDCLLPPLQSKEVKYEEGNDLPVIAGYFQFNLPEKPSSLLAFDGVMAVYPKKEYISYQLISDEHVADTLPRFTTRRLSAAALDRYLYGLDRLEDLNVDDQKLINTLRSDLKLNCHASVWHYRVGQEVDVIYQEALAHSEHRLLFFSNDSTHLISIKGSKERALKILHSIKTRRF